MHNFALWFAWFSVGFVTGGDSAFMYIIWSFIKSDREGDANAD